MVNILQLGGRIVLLGLVGMCFLCVGGVVQAGSHIQHSTSARNYTPAPGDTGGIDAPVYIGKDQNTFNDNCSNTERWTVYHLTGYDANGVLVTSYWCLNPMIATWAINNGWYVLYSWTNKGVCNSAEFQIASTNAPPRSFYVVYTRRMTCA